MYTGCIEPHTVRELWTNEMNEKTGNQTERERDKEKQNERKRVRAMLMNSGIARVWARTCVVWTDIYRMCMYMWVGCDERESPLDCVQCVQMCMNDMNVHEMCSVHITLISHCSSYSLVSANASLAYDFVLLRVSMLVLFCMCLSLFLRFSLSLSCSLFDTSKF